MIEPRVIVNVQCSCSVPALAAQVDLATTPSPWSMILPPATPARPPRGKFQGSEVRDRYGE